MQLRNPPGDHKEWKGDWSDNSTMWNTRIKRKVGYNANADDNTFWMSFDDFCNAYRCLYVCNWLDPAKWKKVSFQGSWQLDRTPPPPITESDAVAASGAVGGDIEQGGEGGGGGGYGDEDEENVEPPAEDTAAGLPSINNLVRLNGL